MLSVRHEENNFFFSDNLTFNVFDIQEKPQTSGRLKMNCNSFSRQKNLWIFCLSSSASTETVSQELSFVKLRKSIISRFVQKYQENSQFQKDQSLLDTKNMKSKQTEKNLHFLHPILSYIFQEFTLFNVFLFINVD